MDGTDTVVAVAVAVAAMAAAGDENGSLGTLPGRVVKEEADGRS